MLPLPVAAAVCEAFGVARSAPVLAAWARPSRDELDGLAFVQFAGTGAVRRVEAVLLAVLATAAIVAA